jgi:hypothetical protein
MARLACDYMQQLSWEAIDEDGREAIRGHIEKVRCI